ncbi:MAG: AEC family transporter [Clostridia bacterium]|nr:AEC family transporter [Clostridia bacterium]
MDSLIFAVSAVLPIILTVALGYILKRIGLFPKDLAKPVNKLVFRVFLPVLLFLNIYKIANLSEINFGFVLYAVVAVLLFFALGIPFAMLVTKDPAKRGPMLQCVFRSNYALIGIPLAQSLFGDEGGAIASILSAFSIPLFNILAVISLSVFRSESENKTEMKAKIKEILIGIAKNPLIIAVVLGLSSLGIRALFINLGVSFRLSDVTPVYKVMNNLSNLATPLALLVLGVQFDFNAVPELKKEIIAAGCARCLAVPALGLAAAYLFFPSFNGGHFAAFVALFATPVAVSSVPMAQEMGGDTQLAGQLVVFTTAVSGFTIFLFSYMLKLLGVF